MSGENVEDLIKKINNEMDLLINDMSVPKNVRSSITEEGQGVSRSKKSFIK